MIMPSASFRVAGSLQLLLTVRANELEGKCIRANTRVIDTSARKNA